MHYSSSRDVGRMRSLRPLDGGLRRLWRADPFLLSCDDFLSTFVPPQRGSESVDKVFYGRRKCLLCGTQIHMSNVCWSEGVGAVAGAR